ncbi:MAG: hypothetical protein IH586_04195 [Anaerolineaceae bacterium]|nr:hypothetical protein [Anaerolineaceae bacterium]
MTQTLTNPERVALHQQWWKCENTQRLALIYTPLPHPYGGLDTDIPVADIAGRKTANALVEYQVPKDVLVTGYVDYATALIPAMLGAGFENDRHTTWAIPSVHSILDVRIPPFDPAQPLFHAYLERVKAILAGWTWETYLPANNAYLGPLDLLAGIIGPEALAIELYEHPAAVKARALDAAAYLVDMLHYELAFFRQAGLVDGTPCAFNYWLPGAGMMFSEDFCALTSRKHYAEFFLEADIAFTQSVDSTLLHVHSAGFQCLPSILDNPHIHSLELANDIDNRDVRKLINAARLVQSKGLPVQVSSWEHRLEEWEMDLILAELDPRGLCVAFQAYSVEEAWRLYEKIKTYPH